MHSTPLQLGPKLRLGRLIKSRLKSAQRCTGRKTVWPRPRPSLDPPTLDPLGSLFGPFRDATHPTLTSRPALPSRPTRGASPAQSKPPRATNLLCEPIPSFPLLPFPLAQHCCAQHHPPLPITPHGVVAFHPTPSIFVLDASLLSSTLHFSILDTPLSPSLHRTHRVVHPQCLIELSQSNIRAHLGSYNPLLNQHRVVGRKP